MSVNNGRRVIVSLPDYSGEAGLVERDGTATLAHPKPRLKTLRAGAEIEIEGEAWTVENVSPSPYVKGFRVISIRKGR